jgi:pimeloyl-ACP methyl ester carboxylesterase
MFKKLIPCLFLFPFGVQATVNRDHPVEAFRIGEIRGFVEAIEKTYVADPLSIQGNSVPFFDSENHDNQSFVGSVSKMGDTVTVAFHGIRDGTYTDQDKEMLADPRGTDGGYRDELRYKARTIFKREWADKIIETAFGVTNFGLLNSDFHVHGGLGKRVMACYPSLMEAISAQGEFEKIIFTGHGGGAALASLAALKYNLDDAIADLPYAKVFMFDSPGFVDTEGKDVFARYLHDALHVCLGDEFYPWDNFYVPSERRYFVRPDRSFFGDVISVGKALVIPVVKKGFQYLGFFQPEPDGHKLSRYTPEAIRSALRRWLRRYERLNGLYDGFFGDGPSVDNVL